MGFYSKYSVPSPTHKYEILHGDAGWSVLPEREFKEVYKNNKVDEKK